MSWDIPRTCSEIQRIFAIPALWVWKIEVVLRERKLTQTVFGV
jgi:hypothetical protein